MERIERERLRQVWQEKQEKIKSKSASSPGNSTPLQGKNKKLRSTVGKWIFHFPCPTLNFTCPLRKLKSTGGSSGGGGWGLWAAPRKAKTGTKCVPCQVWASGNPTLTISLVCRRKELKEQACFMTCPETCAEELCPKCLLVLWMSKHKLTLVPQTK